MGGTCSALNCVHGFVMAGPAWGRGEMADAQVLGTCGAIRKGSSPFVPTNSIITQKNASTTIDLVEAFLFYITISYSIVRQGQ